MKKCTACGEIKELNQFYSQKKFSKKKGEYLYYLPECKDCTIERSLRWQKENPEKRKAYLKIQNKQRREEIREFKKKNKEQIIESQREWKRNNKDKIREYNQFREMNKKHTITKEEWENCKNYFNYRCAYCGLAVEEHFRLHYGEMKQFDLHKEHVDHTGANDLSNCIPSCQSCNSSKHDFELKDWYNKNNENFSQERLNKILKWLNDDYKKYIKQ